MLISIADVVFNTDDIKLIAPIDRSTDQRIYLSTGENGRSLILSQEQTDKLRLFLYASGSIWDLDGAAFQVEALVAASKLRREIQSRLAYQNVFDATKLLIQIDHVLAGGEIKSSLVPATEPIPATLDEVTTYELQGDLATDEEFTLKPLRGDRKRVNPLIADL